MLDEDAYHSVRDRLASLPCAFEKAILSRCAGCGQARMLNLAEREAVACSAASPREACLALLALLHRNAAFALHLAHPDAPLPHAKEMKIQCGGLLGVQRLFEPEAGAIGDVHALVARARTEYGALEAIPYGAVVKDISAYEGRRRR